LFKGKVFLGQSHFIEIFVTKTEVLILSDVIKEKISLSSLDEVRVDEFMQVFQKCYNPSISTITFLFKVCFLSYYKNDNQEFGTIGFENVSPEILENFILTLDFLRHSKSTKKSLIYMVKSALLEDLF